MALTKIVASRSGHRTTLIPFSGIVDDGSTLSLDFTTGVLDPRLTFTRLGNATFINSSGLVQYAFSNRIPNSASLSGFTANGVTATADATEPGPVVAPSGTQATKVTVNGGATTVNLSRNFGPGAGTSTGMTYSIYLKPSRLNNGSGFRYAIRNETTGLNTYGVDVVWANSPVTVNEVIGAADGDYQLSGPDANGWYRLILRVTNTGLIRPGDNLTVYAGYSGQGTGFFDASGAYWVWGAQLEPGLTASPVYLTGATSTGYFDVPRFDYDPTSIGTPRGLLIEGSANNLCTWSQDFSNANWVLDNGSATTPSVSVVSQTAPDGASSVNRITFNKTGGTFSRVRQTLSGTAGATYTFSVWMKANTASGGASTQNVGLRIGADPAGFNCVVTTTWKRFSYSYALSGTDAAAQIMLWDNIVGNDETADVLVWGAQVEAGSGASSYIPTGASTGSRAADNCVTAIGNLTGFNANQGTIYESWRDNTASDTTTVQEWAFAFGTSGANGCGVFVSNAASGTFGLNGGVSNTGDAGPAGTYVIQGVNKAAIAINVATTSLRLSANGSAVSAGTNILGYNGAQTFALGQRNNNSRYLNGWISQFKYWPYVLPDAQLTTLTTL